GRPCRDLKHACGEGATPRRRGDNVATPPPAGDHLGGPPASHRPGQGDGYAATPWACATRGGIVVRPSTRRRWATRGAGALLASTLVLPLAMSGAYAQTETPDEPAPDQAEEPALDWSNYEKLTLTKDTGEPIDLAVLPNSDVLHTARDGVV